MALVVKEEDNLSQENKTDQKLGDGIGTPDKVKIMKRINGRIS